MKSTEENRYSGEIDKKYIRMAMIWAENSYALRKKVGCLIVKNRMIISDGYNGMPSGFPNVCEYVKDNQGVIYDGFNNVGELKEFIGWMDEKGWEKEYELVTKPEVLHAEVNAITKLAKSGNTSVGATIYITYEPCIDCSKLIIQSGIKRVVYLDSYRRHDGIELLKRAGIDVEKISL